MINNSRFLETKINQFSNNLIQVRVTNQRVSFYKKIKWIKIKKNIMIINITMFKFMVML